MLKRKSWSLAWVDSGNIAATYLATSGVGYLILADGDQLESSNLPRQVLYDESQIGLNKVDAAAKQISLKNQAVKVEVIAQKISGDSLLNAVEQADVVLDCTDNFTARQAINRACLSLKKPLVSAAAIRWEGQLMSFLYHQQSTPCYECLYPSLSDQQLSCNREWNCRTCCWLVRCLSGARSFEAGKWLWKGQTRRAEAV